MDDDEEIYTLRIVTKESGELICDVDLDPEQFGALVGLGLETLIKNALND